MVKFDQPAYPTAYFSKKIWVRCPQCSEAALVSTNLPEGNPRFSSGIHSTCSCAHCGFVKKGGADWYGLMQGYVGQSCHFCGSQLTYISGPTKDTRETIELTCEACHKPKEYSVTWYRYRGNEAQDPYFGLDLWLTTTIRGQVLWFYNLEHLRYIKDYVQASLREDNDRHKYSLITNLPQWVKSAKNRETIVSKLTGLESQFKQSNT